MIFEYHSLLERGWRNWSQGSGGLTLLLCPANEFERVPNGTVMVSISGEECVKGQDDIDEDTRSGLLAYGVVVRRPDDRPDEETS